MFLYCRFKTKNVIPWGIWKGRGKPPTITFMKPFVDDMKEIADKGVYVLFKLPYRGHNL